MSSLEKVIKWITHPKFRRDFSTFTLDHHKMVGWDLAHHFYDYALEAMGQQLVDKDFILSTFLANGGFVETENNFVHYTLVRFAYLKPA
jgi:hypothetical protein